MQVVSGGQSLWIYLLFTSLQLWGRLSASTSSPLPAPAPTLYIHARSKSSVVLACRTPEGHRGDKFMLYRDRKKVDSKVLQSGAEEVQFSVRVNEGDPDQLFCCLYQDQDRPFSAFSPYLQLEPSKDAAPTRSIPLFPPPVLSVIPSTGVVKRGDMLSFRCSVPLPSQSQSQQSHHNKPLTFLLLRAAERTGAASVILQPRASRVSNPEPQPSVFSVGPVRGGEEGEYTCIYQFTKRKTLVNSTVSNVVQIVITDALPVPTLVLQQQTDVWHLLCTGSPAYPRAVFSLYLADNSDNQLPVAIHHATMITHQVTFPVPVQDTPVALYQCQYDVLLGGKWSKSEHSLPLAVTRGIHPSSSPDLSGVDWPLVLGSFSAVVLFLCSVALVVVLAHRKVKAAAKEKKRRQEAQFWTKVHAKDHVVDLTLRRTSFTSQEWASLDTPAENASRSPLCNSHSTFTTPIHPIH
ncbi:hypothetical protein VZT92_002515 [Zoarces viviparus]|uniref:Ig-like domain-containing protein n=1 Tax=Zoarces viviparus TaxID=48416 RepID=A0AAW1G193_ZOAVI